MSCLYHEFKYAEHRLASQKEDIDWKLWKQAILFFLSLWESGGAFDLPVSITTLGKVKLTLWTNIPTSIQFTQSNLITS